MAAASFAKHASLGSPHVRSQNCITRLAGGIACPLARRPSPEGASLSPACSPALVGPARPPRSRRQQHIARIFPFDQAWGPSNVDGQVRGTQRAMHRRPCPGPALRIDERCLAGQRKHPCHHTGTDCVLHTTPSVKDCQPHWHCFCCRRTWRLSCLPPASSHTWPFCFTSRARARRRASRSLAFISCWRLWAPQSQPASMVCVPQRLCTCTMHTWGMCAGMHMPAFDCQSLLAFVGVTTPARISDAHR